MKITIFNSITQTKADSYALIEDVYEVIRSCRYSDTDKIKRPCINFTGVFTVRKKDGLTEGSGLMILDYDKVPDVQAYRNLLEVDPRVVMSFISPSKNGLKVVVKIKETTDESTYQEFFNEWATLYPEYLDVEGKDISRTCFYGSDEDVYFNPDAEEFIVNRLPVPEDNSLDVVKAWMVNKGVKYVNGNRNNYMFQYLSAAYRFGIDLDHAVDSFYRDNRVEKLPEMEMRTLKNSVRKTNKFATAQLVAGENLEIDPSKFKNLSTQTLVKVFGANSENIRYNTITRKYEWNDEQIDDRKNLELWSKYDTIAKESGAKRDLSTKIYDSALVSYAKEYNPIQEYFLYTPWDGVSRLDNLISCFNIYKGDVETQRAFIKLFFFGSVERIFNGYQNPVLVLASPKQGIGKSYFVKWIAKPFGSQYFREDGTIDPSNKDSKIELTNKFIYEWGEARDFSKREMSSLKSLLFSDTVTERLPYASQAVDLKVIANIVMTTNRTMFLTDATGNRRFNTVFLHSIEHTYSQVDAAQIWAEVYHIWSNDTAKSWKVTYREGKKDVDDLAFDRPPLWDVLDIIIIKSDNPEAIAKVTDIRTAVKLFDTSINTSAAQTQKTIDDYILNTFGIEKQKSEYRGIQLSVTAKELLTTMDYKSFLSRYGN